MANWQKAREEKRLAEIEQQRKDRENEANNVEPPAQPEPQLSPSPAEWSGQSAIELNPAKLHLPRKNSGGFFFGPLWLQPDMREMKNFNVGLITF